MKFIFLNANPEVNKIINLLCYECIWNFQEIHY